MAGSIPVEERPPDPGPFHTDDLPDNPQRERAIEATAWVEAPPPLLALGDDIGGPTARFLRRIGPWLLWRAGPPRGAASRYWAVRSADVGEPANAFVFDLHPDGSGSGAGPSGETHTRFRSWKEDLRDHP